MDLDGFRTATEYRLGIPSGDSMFTDAVLNSLINTALRHIAAEADWDWLMGTEALSATNGVDTEALAAGYVRTINMSIGEYPPLKQVTVDELDYMEGASGQPKFFSIVNGAAYFRPVPDGSYTIDHRYIKAESTLSNDTDTPLLPAVFHDAVVEYAAYLGFRRINEPTDAKEALESYQMWLAKMHGRGSRYADTTGGGENAVPSGGG